MPREHRLKSLPPYFRAVVEGRKPFEVRKDDRAFDEGDVLVLREWEPMYGFTGAEVRTPVTYVMRGGDFGLERGFAVLGIDVPETYSPAAEEKAWPPPSAADASAAGDVLCRCGDLQSLHAGGETFCANRDCWCLKFIPTKEEASGAESEHRTDRALPELRDAGRRAPVRTEGGDHHQGADGRDGTGGGGVRGSLRAEPDRSVLQPGSAVQRDAEAGPLELAAQGLNDSHKDPELRDQVASVEGSDTREGPGAPGENREAGASRLAGSAVPGEGATASPAAATSNPVLAGVEKGQRWFNVATGRTAIVSDVFPGAQDPGQQVAFRDAETNRLSYAPLAHLGPERKWRFLGEMCVAPDCVTPVPEPDWVVCGLHKVDQSIQQEWLRARLGIKTRKPSSTVRAAGQAVTSG